MQICKSGNSAQFSKPNLSRICTETPTLAIIQFLDGWKPPNNFRTSIELSSCHLWKSGTHCHSDAMRIFPCHPQWCQWDPWQVTCSSHLPGSCKLDPEDIHCPAWYLFFPFFFRYRCSEITSTPQPEAPVVIWHGHLPYTFLKYDSCWFKQVLFFISFSGVLVT